MIQSPDGRPAGIFFHPRTTSSHGSRTPGSGPKTSRRSSGEDRFAAAVKAAHSEQPQTEGADNTPDDASGHSSTSSMSPRQLMSVDASNGNLFTPQVGLHSLLAAERPPTATPLMPLDTSGKAAQPIPMTGLSTELSKARKDDARSPPAEGTTDTSQPPIDGGQPRSPSKVASPAAGHHLTSPTQGRSSFSGADGVNARQTFTSALPAAVARPSAQPQSGLLIGAGFAQPRRRGTLGPRRTAASIEVLPPIKVLIVEDNPINVKILSTFLRQRKIKFGVARDGREAVKEWQTGGYHLILMDIQLPVMDGIEATKEIRKLEQQANIGPIPSATPSVASAVGSRDLEMSHTDVSAPTAPGAVSPSTMLQNSLRASVIIVALTASVLNSDRVAALAAGCNDFLNKPVNLPWLERKVIEWGSMQYLIGFRDLPESYYRRNGGRGEPSVARRTHLSPTDGEVLRSEGVLDRAFGSGPDQLARELAGRLYIGKKARPTATVGDGAQ